MHDFPGVSFPAYTIIFSLLLKNLNKFSNSILFAVAVVRILYFKSIAS